MTDAKTCINDAQEKMDMAVMYLEEALQEYVPHHRKSNYGFRTRYHSRK